MKRLVRLSVQLLDRQTIAKVRVPYLDTAPGESYRKEMQAVCEPATVVGDLGERGINIHEHPKGIVKSADDSVEVREALARLSLPSPPLEFDDGEIALSAVASSSRRDVDNNVGPDLDAVIGQTLLVLLLNDRVTWKAHVGEPGSQLGQEFALVTSLGREETSVPHAPERFQYLDHLPPIPSTPASA